MSKINENADAIYDEIVSIRRQIHIHPEIGGREVLTSRLIREKLQEYGADRIESPVPTAVVALIQGNKGEGRCVGLRADIDGLPVQEETGLPYSSQVSNMMHACGHDMHTAMLLGVAKLLCSMRDEFAGTVKLIFQHSEDTMPGGAKELVEKGILENPHVDGIFGLHVKPDETMGKVGIRKGAMTSAVDIYNVTISGIGGHGSEPQKTTDPILAAAQMIVAMQQIVARRVDPMDTAVISVGTISAGEAVNVIPGQCKFSGVSRAYSAQTRDIIRRQMFDIAKGIENISGCQVKIDHVEGYPTAVNDPALTDMARDILTQELGQDRVIELECPMGFSEDFSYYGMTGIPSMFYILFAGHEGDEVYSLHNPKCAFDEKTLSYGIRAMTSLAIGFLKGK